jgi:NADH-quinone oxidoreductase chain G
MAELVTLSIDGKTIQAPKGATIWQAARDAGIFVPIYCYHPKMPPLGACRICMVEVEKTPKPQAACTTAVGEGMVVRTVGDYAEKARAGVMEFLLINHPLDCPICDKGGECDLQNYAVEYGRSQGRFQEEKRHLSKAVPLGPTIALDRERCIMCQRCVRFSNEIAQDEGLLIDQRGTSAIINTFPGREYDNQFSGNTVEICPVGALTARTYRFKARPWELRHTPSVCSHCSMGCNIEIDTRLGSEVVRFMSRDNAGVDDSWLCDRGRYGYGFIQNENRLKTPLLRKNGKLEPASWADAFDFIVTKLKQIKSTAGSAALGGIASTHSTNEELFLFQLFMRQVLGTNNIDHHHGNFSNAEWDAISWLHTATIAGLEQTNLIVLTLADPSARQPVLELRIKKALRKGAKLVIIGPETPADSKPNPLERFATQVVKVQPEHVAEVLNNLLAALVADGTAKGLQDAAIKDYLSQVSSEHKPVASLGSEQLAKVVQLLASSARISFLYDELATLVPGDENLLDALVKLAVATDQLSQPENGIGMLVSDNNSVGARDMGVLPDYLPGYQPIKDQSSAQPGLNYAAMLNPGGVKGLLVLGEDAIKITPENKAALQALEFLVVSELALSEVGQLAHVVLPAASFAEKDGTFTNWEGRVQKINAAIPPMQGCAPEAAILLELATRLGQPFALRGPGDIFAEVVKVAPLYAGLSYTRIGAQGAFRNYIQPTLGATSGESTNSTLDWLKRRAIEQQASGGVA